MDEKKDIAKKVTIVYVLNILRHTSKDRPVSQTMISDYLNEKGIICNRRTVGRNIGYLQTIGYPIYKAGNKGYYLDAAELKSIDKIFIE